MGALPSRESNEDPSSVFFANCGSHIVFHIPMTEHFFRSPDSLAFRQLFHARNSQSALYCFDMKDVSSVMPEDVAEAFREAQEEDWGTEVDEPDPSLHYHDDEINAKVLECASNCDSVHDDVSAVGGCGHRHRPQHSADAGSRTGAGAARVGRHLRPWIEHPEELYRVLVTEPTRDTLVETDAEMCALYEQEQQWRAALSGALNASAARSSRGSSSTPPPPPPPAKFLYPIPQAIALRMTTEEEEEMRAEYCRKHRIPYVAPTFHDVRPSAVPQQQQQRTPLPVVERRHYHFEDDPQYRDGRVHLVEEHGVLYHFAYFLRKPCDGVTAAYPTSPGTSSAATATAQVAGTTPVSQTPIVRGRCLHDVVYCDEPPTPSSFPSSSLKPGLAVPAGFETGSEPEVAPPVRFGWCARCGERVTQRMDYTQLRRLKSTRAHRRALREGRWLTDGESTTTAGAHDLDSPSEGDTTDEVASNTELVDEEGEEDFIINITPVRVVGLDGLLPSRSRGTAWLRGYEQAAEAAEDAYVERLPKPAPVMRVCRFIEGSVGDKIVNRAALVTLLSYRATCRQAGLREALTRPIWSLCVLSNIPYLQMVRETFFRAKAAVAEVDDKDLLLRNWLDLVDRENNFYNFINANLYMMRNFTPPERTVRHREQPDEVGSNGTAVSRNTNTTSNTNPNDNHSNNNNVNSTCTNAAPSLNAGSSSATSPLIPKPLACGSPTTAEAASGEACSTRSGMVSGSYPAESSNGPLPATAAVGSNGLAAQAGEAAKPTTTTAAAAASTAEPLCDAPSTTTTAPAAAHASTAAVCSTTRKPKNMPGLALAEGESAELRSHHLTRTQEAATIGRPEGHGPRDAVEDYAEDDLDDDAADAERRRKDRKLTKQQQQKQQQQQPPSPRVAPPPTVGTASVDCNSASASAAVTRVGEVGNGYGRSEEAGPDEQGNRRRLWQKSLEDGGEASGCPAPATATAAMATASSAAVDARSSARATSLSPARTRPTRNGAGNDVDAGDDQDPDLRMEEEEEGGNCRGSLLHSGAAAAVTAARGSAGPLPSRLAEPRPLTEPLLQQLQQQQQRPELPPRPDFQLFSSRLEPHAPLSLYTLFDYDASADQTTKRAVTQLAAAAAANANATSAPAPAALATPPSPPLWPSYVQHDVLRENERQQAEPKSLRRPSHALYECGMLATTRGRNLLFQLREDCVKALLHYCAAAAAPIFIGAYIEPVDTTSVSYGGAVRLRRPSTVDITQGGACGEAASVEPLTHYDRKRVVIGLFEGAEVMAEYYRSKNIITCFCVCDVEEAAPGPSAAHRLRKMILPAATTTRGSSADFSTGAAGAAATVGATSSVLSRRQQTRARRGSLGDQCRSHRPGKELNEDAEAEANALAEQQARELEAYGHVFTYAADEFRDGDLAVYNFDERRWEHYEHVQMRRRFAAKAAAAGGGGAIVPATENGNTASSEHHPLTLQQQQQVENGEGSVTLATTGLVGPDGSVGCSTMGIDSSMSARLLCVALDELLLSWTKWVVDNRFYEDRNDLGWLSLPDGSPIQLGGRYFLWSFRHNRQRYFYGVIPKFAKGRLRRQKLMERNRTKKKRETEMPRAQAARTRLPSPPAQQQQQQQQKLATATTPRSGSGRGRQSPSPASATTSTAGATTTSVQHVDPMPADLSILPATLRDPAPAAAATGAAPSSLSRQQPLLASSGPRSLSEDVAAPSLLSPHTTTTIASTCASASPLLSRPSRVGAAPPRAQQQMPITTAHARCDSGSGANEPSGLPTFAEAEGRSPMTSGRGPYAQPAAAGAGGVAPSAQQPWVTSGNNVVGHLGMAAGPSGALTSVRVGSLSNPALAPPSSSPGYPSAASGGAGVMSGRRPPMLAPPQSHPAVTSSASLLYRAAGSPLSYATGRLGLPNSGDQNYYYQHGGNTFIQDGKRNENEYYPPLPPNTPFRPVSAVVKLVPLPHPQAERGGIPAIFRFWGPMGLPQPRAVGGGSPMPGTPTPLTAAHHHPQPGPPSPLHSTYPLSTGGGGGSQTMMMATPPNASHAGPPQPPQHPQLHSAMGSGLSTAPLIVPSSSVTVATAGASGAAADEPVSHLTVRVRRRAAAGGSSATAAIGAGNPASPTGVGSPTAGVVSAATAFGVAPTVLAAAAAGFPVTAATAASAATAMASPNASPKGLGAGLGSGALSYSPHAPSSFPASPVVVASAPSAPQAVPAVAPLTQSLLGGGDGGGGGNSDAGSRRLSPTSMLPVNLINEGSKTKGESLLRVDEDMFMQREAFRWNPYASNKWASNSSNSNGGGGSRPGSTV